MAGFRKDKTGAAQTAANAAATVVAAFAEKLDSVEDGVDLFNELREQLFKDLAKVVDADNEMFAEADAGNGGGNGRSSSRSNGGSNKSRGSGRSGGRGKSSGGGAAFKGDLKDAQKLKLTWGSFEGETLGDIVGYDTDECEDFGYGDGERDGKDYIAWLAADTQKNEYVRDAARLVADDEGISY